MLGNGTKGYRNFLTLWTSRASQVEGTSMLVVFMTNSQCSSAALLGQGFLELSMCTGKFWQAGLPVDANSYLENIIPKEIRSSCHCRSISSYQPLLPLFTLVTTSLTSGSKKLSVILRSRPFSNNTTDLLPLPYAPVSGMKCFTTGNSDIPDGPDKSLCR